MEQNSLRRKRFEVVAARRVQGVLDYLDRLSNCANRANYEYNSEDIRKMFNTIRERVKAIEGTFDKELNKSDKNKFKFQLVRKELIWEFAPIGGSLNNEIHS